MYPVKTYIPFMILLVFMSLLFFSLVNEKLNVERLKGEVSKLNHEIRRLEEEILYMKRKPDFEDLVKVYYMNLDKSVERRNYIENQLSKFNISFERIPAVSGKDIFSDPFVESFFSQRKNKTQDIFFPHMQNLDHDKGYRGIIVSTMKALHYFLVNTTQEWVILFEDDAEIIIEDPKKALLEALETQMKEDSFEAIILDRRSFFGRCCLAGAVYRRRAAKIVLENLNPLNTYFQTFSDKLGQPPLNDFLINWMCDLNLLRCLRLGYVVPNKKIAINSTINYDGVGSV